MLLYICQRNGQGKAPRLLAPAWQRSLDGSVSPSRHVAAREWCWELLIESRSVTHTTDWQRRCTTGCRNDCPIKQYHAQRQNTTVTSRLHRINITTYMVDFVFVIYHVLHVKRFTCIVFIFNIPVLKYCKKKNEWKLRNINKTKSKITCNQNM